MRGPRAQVWRLRRRLAKSLLGPTSRIVGVEEEQGPWPADAQPSFSQEGEDRLLSRLIDGHDPGFYVDVGAHHPTRFSNTALLYSMGWHGINIDPTPGSRPEFDRLRPRDINLEVGIGKPGLATYFIFDEPALNTFSTQRVAELEATTRYRVLRTVEIPVQSLGEILHVHMPADLRIDLLSIDTEGSDLDVLQSNDWTRFRPDIVIAEDLGQLSLREIGRSPVVTFLEDEGFEAIAKTVNSLFFVKTSNG